MTINELRKLMQSFRDEGYLEVYVCDDVANKIYPAHEHDYNSAHFIIEGEMSITVNGNQNTVTSGERHDIEAHVSHSVIIGPEGCLYIVAENNVA